MYAQVCVCVCVCVCVWLLIGYRLHWCVSIESAGKRTRRRWLSECLRRVGFTARPHSPFLDLFFAAHINSEGFLGARSVLISSVTSFSLIHLNIFKDPRTSEIDVTRTDKYMANKSAI